MFFPFKIFAVLNYILGASFYPGAAATLWAILFDIRLNRKKIFSIACNNYNFSCPFVNPDSYFFCLIHIYIQYVGNF